MVEPASPTAGVDIRRDYALRTGAVSVGIDPESVQVASQRNRDPAKATSSHGSAPRRWRLMSQPRMAAAPTSYARHQAGHQAGTPAFSITWP